MRGSPGARTEKARWRVIGLLGPVLTQLWLEAEWAQGVCDRHQKHPYRIPGGSNCDLSIMVSLAGA